MTVTRSSRMRRVLPNGDLVSFNIFDIEDYSPFCFAVRVWVEGHSSEGLGRAWGFGRPTPEKIEVLKPIAVARMHKARAAHERKAARDWEIRKALRRTRD